MLRKIIIPNEEKLVIDLPKNYIGEEIEILVFPVSFNEETVKPIDSKMDFSLFDKYKGTFDKKLHEECQNIEQIDTTEYLLSNPANARHLYQALQDLENPSCYKYVDLAELEKI